MATSKLKGPEKAWFSSLSFEDLDSLAAMLHARSIREVARSQNTEPGNLSKLLKKTEALLGRKLVDRSAQGLSLTEDGRVVLERLEKLRQNTLPLAQLHPRSGQNEARDITIGSVGFLMLYVLAPVLGRGQLTEDFPQYAFRICEFLPDNLQSAAFKGEIEICLHDGVVEWPSSWVTVEVGTLNWRLYENPAAFSTPAQFVLPVYHGPKGFSYGNDFYPEAVVESRGGLGVSSAEAAKRLVLCGNFIGFLPDVVVAEEIKAGTLRAVKGEHARSVSRQLFLSVRADQVSSKFQRKIISEIRAILKE